MTLKRAVGLVLVGSAGPYGHGVRGPAQATSKPGVINAVGAENEYANVLGQIGGRYVSVSSILNNPNTDPHTFESSPKVAEEVSAARLIVQNGAGYDDFMSKIEAASPSAGRKVIVVQSLLHLPGDVANPHLWYAPTTMPAVAKAMAADLSSLDRSHAAYFRGQSADVRCVTPAVDARRSPLSRRSTPGVPVATTEPVADYLLQAMGADNLTPYSFQADIMNGVDPAPQDISLENGFFAKHQVKVFCYNRQVVDALTQSILHNAQDGGVPVVGVYETMPTPGYDYQTWMLAEVHDIERAVADGVSADAL